VTVAVMAVVVMQPARVLPGAAPGSWQGLLK
jgi:hypothetical protein